MACVNKYKPYTIMFMLSENPIKKIAQCHVHNNFHSFNSLPNEKKKKKQNLSKLKAIASRCIMRGLPQSLYGLPPTIYSSLNFT